MLTRAERSARAGASLPYKYFPPSLCEYKKTSCAHICLFVLLSHGSSFARLFLSEASEMDPLQRKEREGRIFHDKDSEPATRENLQEGGSKLTQETVRFFDFIFSQPFKNENLLQSIEIH